MKEYLYRVTLKNKGTDEKFSLFVWAENVDKATHSLCGSLIGSKCAYIWCGSGPVYKDNKLIEREF